MADTDTDTTDSTDTTTEHPGPPKGDAVLEGEADADAIVNAIERAAHPRNEDVTDPAHVSYFDARENRLPELQLPGFGQPEDDCGDYVLPAMRFCTKCGKTHEFKHNCLRYDCPQHAPYAIRRRAAGAADAAGMAPKLKSLLLRLYSARNKQNHHYHHLFVSLAMDEPWLFESEKPLERAREVLRDMMDELGIQGALIYHPWRGPDEGPDEDDRGFWKDLLFKRKDWNDVKHDLRFEPHFHIVGVAPHVDVSVTEKVEEETGWVISRREDEQGRSIARNHDEENDDNAMARTLTYALSHAGVYETASGQRRLGAWMKGPDVHTTQVFGQVKSTISEKVYGAAETVLGIDPPELECDHEPTVDEQDDPAEEIDADADGSVDMNTMTRPVASQASGASAPWDVDGNTDGRDLPSRSRWDEFEGSASSSTSRAPPPEDDVESDRDCGGYLKHISQAGEYLLDEDWRTTATYVQDLDTVYRDYISYMTSRDLEPLEDGVPTLPEHESTPPPG